MTALHSDINQTTGTGDHLSEKSMHACHSVSAACRPGRDAPALRRNRVSLKVNSRGRNMSNGRQRVNV